MVPEGDFIGTYLVVLLEFTSFGEGDLDSEFVNPLVAFSNWLTVGLLETAVPEEAEDFTLLRRTPLERTIFCFTCDALVVMEVGVMQVLLLPVVVPECITGIFTKKVCCCCEVRFC